MSYPWLEDLALTVNGQPRKSKVEDLLLLSTSALGAFIFIDDYFNCLTVGTVMRPITDTYRISRAKLAYIIDATAAPICIIAPISSWAAAVGSNLKSTGAFESEMEAFVSTIPWNFYALLCIIMVIMVSVGNFDFGPMRRSELAAIHGESKMTAYKMKTLRPFMLKVLFLTWSSLSLLLLSLQFYPCSTAADTGVKIRLTIP